MNKDLTIVMYHYVRPILNSSYPGIKGLELDGFVRQLDYLQENFHITSFPEILSCLDGSKPLPQRACWLTFDDGYREHFDFVFPELHKRGLQGSFFPPAAAILDQKLLDVNAIHHILACSKHIRPLVTDLNQACLARGVSESQLQKLWDEYGQNNRFDSAEVIYVKRLLQHALDEDMRNEITHELFESVVGKSTSEFARELYMSQDDVSVLVDAGMHVGSHGTEHYWLSRLSEDAQRKDIETSLNFLEHVGASREDWAMCYPFGAHNDNTLSIVRELGGVIGLTTRVDTANLGSNNALALPRYDTNDFPQ